MRELAKWYRFPLILCCCLWANIAVAAPFAFVGDLDNRIWVIDVATNTVVTAFAGPVQPAGIALNPEGTRLYVTGQFPGRLAVYDVPALSLIASIPVGSGALSVVVSASRAYVTNPFDDTISILDTATNSVLQTVPVGDSPRGIALMPDGSRAYIANNGSNTLSVLDTSSNTVVDAIAVGANPFTIAISRSGEKLYLLNQDNPGLWVIDTASNSVVAVLPGIPQGHLTTSPVQDLIVAAYDGGGVDANLAVIDAATDTVSATFAMGDRFTNGVAIEPSGAYAYVLTTPGGIVADGAILVVDLSNGLIVASPNVGPVPRAFGGRFIGGVPLAATPASIPGLTRSGILVMVLALSIAALLALRHPA